FDNYYVGGIGSVRGFDNGSLGPQDNNGYALGGTRKAVASTELLFPFPGMRDNKSVRMSVFADAGTVWGDDSVPTSASQAFRYSTGLALTWLSPVGPMKFSYAMPMHKKEGDKIQRLQFQLGTVF
ncbi:MAG: BamA/TamA family outer membrane protein, partial [Paludibacterium sp.]